MSRMYKSDKGLVTMVGKIKSISDDKMSAAITVDKWDLKEKKNVETDEVVYTADPITDKVGDLVTVQGWVESSRGVSKILAEVFSTENVYCEMQDGNKKSTNEPNMKALLAGRVLFASERTELNEDGTPKLNHAGQPRKPHFDITIAVGSGKDKVNHIIKFYDFAERKSKDGDVIPAQKNIDRYKRAFAKFDREANPIYVWCMTTPGSSYQTTNGQYTNFNMSHMGAFKMDIEYLKAKEQEKDKDADKDKDSASQAQETAAKEAAATQEKKEEPVAETKPEPQPTADAEKTGFDVEGITLDDSDFTMEE